MRHGVAFRKLSRDSQHRDMLLRNLVSSLLAHERIQTTFAKAKEAARVAEWVIGWGKSGRLADTQAARKFLLNQEVTMPKLFQVLSHRYSARQGGYTRVHRYGYRKGDHAPSAILELVDGPNDLRFNMAAKIAGRELASLASGSNKHVDEEARSSIKRWAAQSTSIQEPSSDIAEEGTEASTSTASSSAGPSFSLDSLPAVYKLLSIKTQESIIKALRFRQSQPPLTPPSSSSSPLVSPLDSFQSLVRDSYFRATVISKVPSWEIDTDKLEALQAASSESSGGSKSGDRASTSRIPLTLPGRGRKLWAGQEGSNPHDRLIPALRSVKLADAPGITQEEHEAALEQATREAEEEEATATRLQAGMQKKARHATARNGAQKPAGMKERQSRGTALGRAKGHLAPAKGLKEFRVTGRAELPRAKFVSQSQQRAAL